MDPQGEVVSCVVLEEERRTELVLGGDQRLQVDRGEKQDVVRLVAADGSLRLTIIVTPQGPVLHFEGGDVALRMSGALDIAAQRITLRSREKLSLEAEGDAAIRVTGHLQTEALSQGIVAHRGDVAVYANDDVRIDGERIRMNC